MFSAFLFNSEVKGLKFFFLSFTWVEVKGFKFLFFSFKWGRGGGGGGDVLVCLLC